MKRTSAGILVYRKKNNHVEVFIGHHGSPLWSRRDLGAWTIPKGTYDENEAALDAAKREFTEETGHPVPPGELQELGSIEQRNNKIVLVWAVESDLDASKAKSNTFEMEWPPKSGKTQEFPELDKLEWFGLPEAATKINPHQVPFLERLANRLGTKLIQSPSSEQGQLQLEQ